MKTIFGRFVLCGLVLLCVVVVFPVAARAGSDYSDKSFGLRLPPAFMRFREVATMGGESVANRFSSAINPASTDWNEVPSRFGVVLAPYTSHVCFGEGTKLRLYAQAINWDTRDFGTIQPSLSQIRSNQATTRTGLEFDYKADVLQVQWGKRVEDAAVGMNFNFARSRLIHRLGSGGMKISESNAESYRWRFGGLWEPLEKWLVGAIFEYGFAPYRATTSLPTPFGIFTTRDRAVTHQYIFRPGVSYEYAPMSSAYFDYQFGLFTQHSEKLRNHRFNFGADHRLR